MTQQFHSCVFIRKNENLSLPKDKRMLMAALFTIAKNWKKYKHPTFLLGFNHNTETTQKFKQGKLKINNTRRGVNCEGVKKPLENIQGRNKLEGGPLLQAGIPTLLENV